MGRRGDATAGGADRGRSSRHHNALSGRARLLASLLGALTLTIALADVATAASGPPVNTAAPSIAGAAKDGASLKALKGSWTGAPTITYAYQWQRCDAGGASCAAIPGATAVGRHATHEDVGRTLRVLITATNSLGSASATTAPTAVIVAIPPVKSVHPKITGVAKDGQPLTVSNGIWKGTPPFSYSYEWEDCNLAGTACVIVAGAHASTYRPTTSQINTRLRAIVTATNSVGSASANTLPSGKVVAGPPVNLAAPSISGSLTDGQTLTAATGTWVGTTPISYSYQWQRCALLGGGCQAIAGATSPTYSIGVADIASKLTVVVKASNGLGFATATSEETQPILALLPSNTVTPTISGLLQDGQLLSVLPGTWTGSGPISYAYQWQLCNPLGGSCMDISEAVGSTLQLSPADIGGLLQVVVTATNAAGSSSVTTSLTGLIDGILPSNTGLPSISGLLQDGQLLGLATGSWSGSAPITYSYQWQECNAAGKACTDIAGETGSALKLLTGLIGSTVDVVVTATNAAGSTSATSPVSGLVGGLLPSNTGLPSISGLLQDGQLLGLATGSWSGSAPITYSYQWQQCNA
ncbi:MAG TPA: hypothetical protein VII01_01530, partial [Solirubrobacteraceae bacterium]